MAGNIRVRVDTNALVTTAGDVRSLARQLSDKFEEMQQKVEQTRSYWIGEAGDQYRRTFSERRKDTQEVLGYIEKYPGDLLSMAGVYVEAESSNKEKAGALDSDIL